MAQNVALYNIFIDIIIFGNYLIFEGGPGIAVL